VRRSAARFLLVSGEPAPGGAHGATAEIRTVLSTWCTLRSCSAEKQDGVPVTKLSLIAFPTRELFMEKIEDSI